MRKTVILIVLIAAAGNWCLYSIDDTIEKQVNNQAYISEGKDLHQQLNRLGTIIVQDIYNGIKDIKQSEWKTLGIKNRKLNVLILFSRLDLISPFALEEFRFPVRLDIYQQLTYAMARAAQKKSGDKSGNGTQAEFLYFDVFKLKQILKNPGINSVERAKRRTLGLYKNENAVFEIILSINRAEKRATVGGRLYTVESGEMLAFSNNYSISAGSIIDRYPEPDWARVFNGGPGTPAKGKNDMFSVSKIIYLRPGTNKEIEIKNGDEVQSGGRIWFEITVKEPGGYFLAVLQDSQKKVFNVFPGTRNAVVNGDYRIPASLTAPQTTVQKTVAENREKMYSSYLAVSDKKFILGGYSFDNNPGLESLLFFYSGKRIPKLEAAVKEAEEIGVDLLPTRGVKPWTSPLPYKPFSNYEVIRLHFIHK